MLNKIKKPFFLIISFLTFFMSLFAINNLNVVKADSLEPFETKSSLYLESIEEGNVTTISKIGIRFGSKMSKALYDSFKNENNGIDPKFGVYVTKSSTFYLTSSTYERTDISAVRVDEDGKLDNNGQFYQFGLVLENIPESDWSELLSSQAYVVINGNKRYATSKNGVNVEWLATQYLESNTLLTIEEHLDYDKPLSILKGSYIESFINEDIVYKNGLTYSFSKNIHNKNQVIELDNLDTSIDLTGISSYKSIKSITLNETNLNTNISALNIDNSMFGDNNLKVIVTDNNNVDHTININLLVCSNAIRSKSDFFNYCFVSTNNVELKNEGKYYALLNDINFNGLSYCKEGNTPAAWNNQTTGFAGTFDGRGYRFYNGKIDAWGLFGGLKGAVIKDFILDINTMNSVNNDILGGWVTDSIIKNVTINIDPSVNQIDYIFAQQVMNTSFNNITVNAYNASINYFIGPGYYVTFGNNTYNNCVLYANNCPNNGYNKPLNEVAEVTLVKPVQLSSNQDIIFTDLIHSISIGDEYSSYSVQDILLNNISLGNDLSNLDISNINIYGEAYLIIKLRSSLDSKVLVAPVTLVTDVIRTREDFLKYCFMSSANKSKFNTGTYFILGNDIDFNNNSYSHNGVNWAEYGGEDYGFSGTLDGRGYKFYNGRSNGWGLFGALTSACIKNLTINVNSMSATNVAIIASTIYNSKLENITINLNESIDSINYCLSKDAKNNTFDRFNLYALNTNINLLLGDGWFSGTSNTFTNSSVSSLSCNYVGNGGHGTRTLSDLGINFINTGIDPDAFKLNISDISCGNIPTPIIDSYYNNLNVTYSYQVGSHLDGSGVFNPNLSFTSGIYTVKATIASDNNHPEVVLYKTFNVNHNFINQVIPATCESLGYNKDVCACGIENVISTTKAHSATMGWVFSESRDCYECLVCHNYQEEVINKKIPTQYYLNDNTNQTIDLSLFGSNLRLESVLTNKTGLTNLLNGSTVNISAIGANVGEESTFELTVYSSDNTKHNINYKVIYVTDILYTFEDLAKVRYKYNSSLITDINGYYVLANDIDCLGKTITGGTTNGWNPGHGFMGTFNGLGHTIKNFSVGYGGLFGCLGRTSTVMNINFENVNILSQDYAGIFGACIYGTNISNVYIKLNSVASNAKSGIFGGGCETQPNFTDVTVDASGLDIKYLSGCSLVYNETTKYQARYKNVVIYCKSIEGVATEWNNDSHIYDLSILGNGIRFIYDNETEKNYYQVIGTSTASDFNINLIDKALYDSFSKDTIINYIEKDYDLTKGKFIVIGNEIIAKTYGVTIPSDKDYIVKSVDDDVIILARNTRSYQIATIEFLREYLGRTTYSTDLTVYDKKSSDFVFSNVLLTGVAIYNSAQSPNNISTDGKTLNFEVSHSMGFIEAYNITSVEARFWHTAFSVLPIETYKSSHPYWYSTDELQLCYTAHGDSLEYEQMVNAAVECLKPICLKDKRNVVTISMNDSNTYCTCSECLSYIERYGSITSTVIKFINDVEERLNAYLYLEANKVTNIYFLAYSVLTTAPTKNLEEVKMNEHTGICYAPLKYHLDKMLNDSTNVLSDTDSRTYYDALVEWTNLTRNISYWLYETDFTMYLYPLCNYKALVDNYRLIADFNKNYDINTFVFYSQGQTKTEQMSYTGFTALKEFIGMRCMIDPYGGFNNTEDYYNALVDEFFSTYYGEAKNEMLSYFNSLNSLWLTLRSTYNITNLPYDTFSTSKGVNAYGGDAHLASEKYFSEAQLDSWISTLNSALDKLDKSNPNYEIYRKHILAETVFPRFAKIQIYGYSIKNTYEVAVISFSGYSNRGYMKSNYKPLARSLYEDMMYLGFYYYTEFVEISTLGWDTI